MKTGYETVLRSRRAVASLSGRSLSGTSGLLFCAVLALSGCVSGPVYESLQPDAPLPASNPGVRSSGTTPDLRVAPAGQSPQITDTEKRELEAEMKRAGVQNKAAVSQTEAQSEAAYKREVEAMRREAESHAQRRLREIEARSN